MKKTSNIANLLLKFGNSEIIYALSILLFFMQKFGKALSELEVLNFLEKEYKDVFDLYNLLGRTSFSISQCQKLLLFLGNNLDTRASLLTSHTHLVGNILSDDINIKLSQDIGLFVIKNSKIYKRNLNIDLSKMSS